MMGNIVFVVSYNEEVDEVFTRRCKAEAYIEKESAINPALGQGFHIDVYELDPEESQYG
tara:strand:- start:4485 stop:4661 length:177 start_codon:yes stop_codon:yes gene_type:complete